MVADKELAKLTNGQIEPINAAATCKGNFITTTRTGYTEEDHKEITTVEVELCSPDYDTAVLHMLEALRKVLIRMRNDGHDARIIDCDEYKYAHVEGGQTWNAEHVTINLTNIHANIEISDNTINH